MNNHQINKVYKIKVLMKHQQLMIIKYNNCWVNKKIQRMRIKLKLNM